MDSCTLGCPFHNGNILVGRHHTYASVVDTNYRREEYANLRLELKPKPKLNSSSSSSSGVAACDSRMGETKRSTSMSRAS